MKPVAPSRPMPWALLENVALVLMLIAILVFRDELEAASLVTACRITTAIMIVTTATVIRAAPRGMWSPSAVFFIIVVLFHGGLVAAYGLGHEAESDFESTRLWLYRPSTLTALWLTNLACLGYAIGARIGTRWRPPRRGAAAVNVNLDQVIGVAGVILTIGALGTWFLVVLARGGPGLLVSSYENFLTQTQGSVLPTADRMTDYGMVFIAASTWTRGHKIAVAFYVVWALFAFPLGLRGEVLFPASAALALMAARRIPMRASRATLLALALLAAIAMIRDLRQVGVKDVGTANLSVNPLDGLVEMGSSLRPVSEVVFWHQMGDPFDNGATYWAPIDRAMVYVIPGWTRPPIFEDHRVMNVLTMERAGPIGFSVVAEAYRNFAAPGAFFVLLLVGLALSRVDRWPGSLVHQCAGGVILTGFLIHVRNSFVPLPSHFAIGFILIGVLILIARARAERMRRVR